ncbi:hypothetical protein ANACOL_01679 [Anaerotruncus colihominis DSM 17241]|uniref:Uncharacterized protein n=1 Tax=Anaerotruncus colihominis DSM 17241 TaxID=445972 RepID=B0PAA9_9FIRM|nr:hypothetical protein ANACOL_01679 [Anaerotruncus colihominis DSM 17241]
MTIYLLLFQSGHTVRFLPRLGCRAILIRLACSARIFFVKKTKSTSPVRKTGRCFFYFIHNRQTDFILSVCLSKYTAICIFCQPLILIFIKNIISRLKTY